MKKEYKYLCKVCNKETALLRDIFITSTNRFRAKFYCPYYNHHLQVTINYKEWIRLNYSFSQVKEKIKIKLGKLLKEFENINRRVG